MEEREAAKEAREEIPESTPPAKKAKKIPADKAAESTSVQPAEAQEQPTPAPPSPQASTKTAELEEGRTASESTEKGEEEEKTASESTAREQEEGGKEISTPEKEEKEVEAPVPLPQKGVKTVKRKLEMLKPPLPPKGKPASVAGKTFTKGEQSKTRRATAVEKGKKKAAEPEPEEDPEKTETVESSNSGEVPAPKKQPSSITVAKLKTTKRKGIEHPTASEAIIPRDSQRYAVLQKREITPWYVLVTEVLTEFGIKEKVEEYFAGIEGAGLEQVDFQENVRGIYEHGGIQA